LLKFRVGNDRLRFCSTDDRSSNKLATDQGPRQRVVPLNKHRKIEKGNSIRHVKFFSLVTHVRSETFRLADGKKLCVFYRSKLIGLAQVILTLVRRHKL
jgi:hypothetical protein